MKHAVACLLILALVIPAEARERTPLEQAKKIGLGSRVKVTLKTKETIVAILLDVEQDSVRLRAWPDREVPFQGIQKITPSKEHSAVKEALLAPVVVIALPLFFVYCIFAPSCLGQIP